MTTLTCPKCRKGITDDALDAGQCPACGFPFDGPLLLPTPGRAAPRLLLAGGLAALLAGGAAGYAFWPEPDAPAPKAVPEVAAAPLPAPPVVHVAPLPHEPKSDVPQAKPAALPQPKKGGPRPLGVVMKVDPKVAAVRRFDHPDDTAALPDLNGTERVVLTGRVRALRIGSVNGRASLDASGLVAEEVVIGGDLNAEAVVKVNAPNGKVTVGGFVFGSSKLTITAPGGRVLIADSSRISGGSVITITAKRVEARGRLTGGSRVNVTLTRGGSLKLALMEEGATLTYRKAAPNDPPPAVEKGQLRGGAKVLQVK